MEGSVLSFLKAEWKVSDTGSVGWASSFLKWPKKVARRFSVYHFLCWHFLHHGINQMIKKIIVHTLVWWSWFEELNVLCRHHIHCLYMDQSSILKIWQISYSNVDLRLGRVISHVNDFVHSRVIYNFWISYVFFRRNLT